MANHHQKRGLVSRFIVGTVDTFSLAYAASELSNTPESVFRARGTTRERAIRDLFNMS